MPFEALIPAAAPPEPEKEAPLQEDGE
jgi:hypothetical protein